MVDEESTCEIFLEESIRENGTFALLKVHLPHVNKKEYSTVIKLHSMDLLQTFHTCCNIVQLTGNILAMHLDLYLLPISFPSMTNGIPYGRVQGLH